MQQGIQLFVGILLAVFAFAGGPETAVAQDKGKDTKAPPAAKAGGAVVKKIMENDKVLVQETTLKPGDENTNVPRDARVVRALTTGTLQRTYPGGKTDKIEFKAGDVRFNEAVTGPTPQYVTKNVGNTDLVLYVVALKGTSQPAPAKK